MHLCCVHFLGLSETLLESSGFLISQSCPNSPKGLAKPCYLLHLTCSCFNDVVVVVVAKWAKRPSSFHCFGLEEMRNI